jgi:hypothetical protein
MTFWLALVFVTVQILIAGNSIKLIASTVTCPAHLNALSNVTVHKEITNLQLDMLDIG